MIRSIQLKNFKCFKEQTLEAKAITLLTGVNGLGKSTFIQSLLVTRQSFFQNILPRNGLSLNGDFLRLGTAKDVLFEFADEEKIGVQIKYSDGELADFCFNYDDPLSDVIPLAENTKVSEKFYSKNLFTDDFHYLSAERIGPRNSFELSDNHVNHHRQIGNAGQYTAHFLAAHGAKPVLLKEICHEEGGSDTLTARVESWLNLISPGTRISVTPHPGMGLVNLEYSFARGGSVSRNYRPTNVGFGITFILPVLVAVLSAQPGTLLLVENPEAHLHPKGQSMLAQLIAKAAASGVQVIVESHSDHFLNGLRIAVRQKIISPDHLSANFFQFDPNSKSSKITKIGIDENGRVDNWPEDFFDEWEKSLEKLM